MPLNIKMVPFERICVGTSTVTNCCSNPAKISIDGTAPILRQVYTMLEDRADTPLKRVYLCLQKLYLGFEDATPEQYDSSVRILLDEMPDAVKTVEKAGSKIMNSNLFGAIQEYRDLLNSTNSACHNWTTEFTGQFQPKIDLENPPNEPIVIRPPRRKCF